MQSRWLMISALVLLAACGGDVEFTAAEWSKVKTLSPLPDPPADPTNKYQTNAQAAALGQKLFHERDWAGPLLVGNDGTNGALGAAGETKKVSCRDCHLGPWFIDTRSKPNATSLGTGWMARNSRSMVNVAHYVDEAGHTWIESDGLLDSLWGESIVDIEFDLGFNSSRLRLAHVIYEQYRDDYNAIFPPLNPALDPTHPEASRFPADARPKASPTDPDGPWEKMQSEDREHVNQIMANVGKALAAYLHKLVSKNAPFDKFVAGDNKAMSASAKRGLKLFIGKAGCVECHSGPHFSDTKFHNTALAPRGPKATPTGTNPTDWPLGGRYAAIPFITTYPWNTSSPYSDKRDTGRLNGLEQIRSEELGKWRTTGLRNVAETAPYMRDGQFQTLREVVEFYVKGGDESGFVGTKSDKMKKLNLTAQEINDLVAFLESLTGEQVPTELQQDTSVK